MALRFPLLGACEAVRKPGKGNPAAASLNHCDKVEYKRVSTLGNRVASGTTT